MAAMQHRVLGASPASHGHGIRSTPARTCPAAHSRRGHCVAAAAEVPWSPPEPRRPPGPAMGQQQLLCLARALQSAAAPAQQQQQQLPRTSFLQSLLALRAERRLGVLLGAAAAPALCFADLGQNYVFLVGFAGWFVAQFLKIFTKRFKTGVWDVRAFVDAGGTPSSHSALCSAVTTAIAVQQGLSSPLFAVALCFSVIVMYDAMGVRRHAGLQAEVLNLVVEDLMGDDHPVAERRLKEVLGHTPRQVVAGALTGILIGFFYRPC